MPKKRANASVKKDIATAVDTLPKLIAQEVYRNSASQTEQTTTPALSKNKKREFISPVISSEYTKKRRMVSAGVAVLTLLVFGMWFWNARAVLYDVNNGNSVEAKIFDSAKDDLSSILDSVTEPSVQPQTDTTETLQKNATENDVRAALKTILTVPVTTATPTAAVLGITITSTPEFPTPEMRTTTENNEGN